MFQSIVYLKVNKRIAGTPKSFGVLITSLTKTHSQRAAQQRTLNIKGSESHRASPIVSEPLSESRRAVRSSAVTDVRQTVVTDVQSQSW